MLDFARRVLDKEVRLADVQPGWVFASSGISATTGSVITPTPVTIGNIATPSSAAPVFVTTTPASSIAPSAPRVDATGIVANVEPATVTITLQDGRVIGIAPGTTVWQPVTIGSVVPGASVSIHNAQPLDFRPAALPAARPLQMGTVSTVDASNARVLLSDGTVVHLRPGSQLMINGQSLAVSDLRPGDEVVVGMPSASTVAIASTAPAASALPRQTVPGVLEGEYLYVVRRPQSP